MAISGQRGAGKISLVQGEEPSLHAWLGLVRVYSRMQRALERVLDDAGLTLPQFDVLANLGMSEGITQQELAERLLVTKGNVCGLLDRMEAAELVQRKPDPEDRRTNRLHLTRQGRSALREAFPAHLRLIRECFDAISVTEQRSLTQLLARIENGGCFG
jgi:DNA-binding MarR family transcriptional regulator